MSHVPTVRAVDSAAWGGDSSLELQITVIGAGLAGLMLARTLQAASIDVIIFEADASRNARSQGGTLDIYAKSGQWALKKAHTLERF